MEFSGEARTFLSITLTGMILGCVFDVFRTTRNAFKMRSAGLAVADILYWLVAIAVVFGVLIAVNMGQIRFYIFIALAAGAAVYFRFLSRRVLVLLLRLVRFSNKIKNLVTQALRAIFLTIALKPLRFISLIAQKPLRACGRAIKHICRLIPSPKDKPPG